jgi:hypothetical protein
MLGGWKSINIKLFYLIFWFPFLFVVIATFISFFKKIRSLSIQEPFSFLLLAMFFSIIILMTINRGDDSYFVIYTLFVSLVFVSLLRFGKQMHVASYENKKLVSMLLLTCMVLTVFMHSLIHTVKFVFSSQKYYYAPDVHKVVLQNLKPGDTLFIAKKRQVGCFYDMVEAKYRGDSGVNNIYIVFAQPALDYDKMKLRSMLKNKIGTIAHDKTVWGVWKKSATLDKNNKKLRVMIPEIQPKNAPPLYLFFDIKSIVYEDKDHLFFRPERITFEEL